MFEFLVHVDEKVESNMTICTVSQAWILCHVQDMYLDLGLLETQLRRLSARKHVLFIVIHTNLYDLPPA
jgi:hypothetical protein